MRIRIAIACLALLALACDNRTIIEPDNPPPDDTPEIPVVAYVTVSPQAVVLEIGAARQYSARVFDTRGNELTGRTVTWSTTTPQVISVSPNGMVRALASGYADVHATVEGHTGGSVLTVPTPEPQPEPPLPVRYVVVTPNSGAIWRGSHVQLRAHTLVASGGEVVGRAIQWSSENPSVLMVDAQGRVTGTGAGTTRVRAVSEGVAGFATITVRELPGSIQNYALQGTTQLPVNHVEIGQTTWTDANGVGHAAMLVVRGGTLRLDFESGRYEKNIVVETRLLGSQPSAPAAETQTLRETGLLLYDFLTGVPVLRRENGSELRPTPRQAGEYVLSESVLGRTAQPWLWVLQ